jgi:hypothetical protein
MFSLDTILAWSINIIMNKKYDNNNIIIASRAYFLQCLLIFCVVSFSYPSLLESWGIILCATSCIMFQSLVLEILPLVVVLCILISN